jgi:hypothetical protein
LQSLFYSSAQLGLDFENPGAKTAFDVGNGVRRAEVAGLIEVLEVSSEFA